MSQSGLRRGNRRRLLRAIVENGPTPRARLADHLGLTPAAVSRVVREMISAGVLDDGEKFSTEGRPGRKFVNVGFASRKLFVIGIGFEAFSQAVVIADLTGEVVALRSLGLTSFGDTEAVFDRIAEDISKLLDSTGIAATRVIGIGAAVVGTVDRAAGRIVESSHLGWADVPMAAALEARTGLPVVVENLLHSTNLAEHAFGVSKGRGEVLLVRTSLSIGASLIVDHRLARGAFAKAGQIAHVRVPEGRSRCACGAVGCLETLASGRAIVAMAENRPFHDLAGDDIGALSWRLSDLLTRAQDGERKAHRAVFGGGRSLGRALGWPIATLDPGCVVLSGPVARHPSYVGGVRLGLTDHHIPFEPVGRRLMVSAMPIREVALRLAIGEFLMVRDLDFAALETIAVSAHVGARTESGLGLGAALT